MSLVDELIKELESDPEKAKKLLEKMAELYSELSFSLQIRKLAEKMSLMVEEQTKIWQEISKIWQEIKAIKEEQTKIWQEISKIWQEIKAIKEEQTKIWQEISKIWQEIKAIKEEQTKIWQEIKELKIGQNRLERKIDHIYEGLSASIMYVFGELSQYAGMTFEEFVRKFLTDRMRRAGEIPTDRELKPAVIEGEEIDAFLEDPLIVVEITAHAKSPEKIEKLLRKAEKIREAYGREPRKILIVQTADKDVAKELRRIAEREDVELIIGRIL
ncbi:hypothetical protein [Candidatus Korarchaeum cryptofilum]|uniref:DUF3782 domain-containing protein n=1 Tax=Korarchaeum cryptofilum (strain OPF8) TaxID=374847 RepID=B1L3W7_KORCO|nr:hypothetical protein [Candidatus Korarchaeum cryptofilum]ACB07146.1 conserved hypothetical protein [Candidatus Korarchaeum cryptofilum OPF8]